MANAFDLDFVVRTGYFSTVLKKGSEKKGEADVGKRAIRDYLQLFSNHRFSCAVTEG